MSEGVLVCGREDLGGAEALEGGLWCIEAPFEMRLSMLGGELLADEAHDGLEEVVEEAHLGIELIERVSLGNRIEAHIAQVAAYQGGILLFDEAIVILVVGTAAREGDAGHLLLPEAQQVGIEDFTAVVRVDFMDGEGRLRQERLEGSGNHQLTTP